MKKEFSNPEIKLSSGVINATVWKNQKKNHNGSTEVFRTVSFERRYVDKDGNWKSTNCLRIQDLPKAAMVLEKAYQHLNLKQRFAEDVI